MDIIDNEQDPLRAYLRLEEFYRLTSAEMRAAIRGGWSFGRHWSVPGLDYSDRDLIVFAPLTGNDVNGLDVQARIEARLTYHSIENARSDFRDNIMDICLCYHVALRTGLDFSRIFGDAAAISESKMAEMMLRFILREPERRSLWIYGFRAAPFENGIAFEWIGNDDNYDSLKPKALDSMGREVSG